MNYRQSQLLAAKSITTAGTEVLPINVRDPISRLTAIVRLTNSSWTPSGHPAKVVVKMELLDGSDVLHSARGVYSQAAGFYGTRKQPFNYINFTDNGLAVAAVPINFGRKLYDPELALVPDKFNNLQLNIQHSYLLGGAVPDAATLEVWADLFDEKAPNPIGFLTTKSIWSKTLVASATDYVDLPTDHPIRLIMIGVDSNSEEPDINLDNFKITEEHDKRTLVEVNTLAHLQMIESMYPQLIEYGEGRTLAANNVYFYFTPAKDLLLAAQPSEDIDNYINFPWSGGNRRYIMGSATSTINITAHGRCPHGTIPIPMGDQDDLNDWWDVTKLSSARIKMVTGAGDTSALYELLTQQLRRY